jgi:hypothetical protein
MQIRGESPPQAEILAFCRRLVEIMAAGGSLSLIQIYTVARRPAESFVAPLSDEQVDEIAEIVRRETGMAVVSAYGGGG